LKAVEALKVGERYFMPRNQTEELVKKEMSDALSSFDKALAPFLTDDVRS